MKWPVWISVLDNEDDKPCYNGTTSKTLEVKKQPKKSSTITLDVNGERKLKQQRHLDG